MLSNVILLWLENIYSLKISFGLSYYLPSEKAMATHSSTLAWKTPCTEEPGGLQSMESHRVGHNWSDLAAVAAAALSTLENFQYKLEKNVYFLVLGWGGCSINTILSKNLDSTVQILLILVDNFVYMFYQSLRVKY